MPKFLELALHEAVLAAVYGAARRSAAMAGRLVFEDADFDVGWAMWRLLRSVVPERPPWLRPTKDNRE